MPSFAAYMDEAPLIATPGPLNDLMGRLASESCIALDTEASSFHRFHERIGLIQTQYYGPSHGYAAS